MNKENCTITVYGKATDLEKAILEFYKAVEKEKATKTSGNEKSVTK